MDLQLEPTALSLRERSEFFRGLLLVMAADGDLHGAEQQMIRDAISPFDFSPEYVQESIESVLQNRHISQEPPRFASEQNAQVFLLAAIAIAFADGILDESEEKWLRETAKANGVPAEWLEAKISSQDPGSTNAPAFG